jgi:hypothetical protein
LEKLLELVEVDVIGLGLILIVLGWWVVFTVEPVPGMDYFVDRDTGEGGMECYYGLG